MADPDDAERLKRLGERIEAAKGAGKPAKPHQEEHYSQANIAWRMVIDLVAGIAIGFGIGLGLDTLIGTKPIFLILFTLLGFAAGVKTMIASARDLQDQKLAEAAKRDDEE